MLEQGTTERETMTTRKPTDEEFDKMIEESSLNRKEKRALKFKQKAMKQLVTHSNRPQMQSLEGTTVVKNSTSKGH